MSRRSRHRKPGSWPLPRLLFAVAALLLIAWLLWPGAQAPQPRLPTAMEAPQADAPVRVDTPLPDFLPAEAGPVIQRIRSSATRPDVRFPHAQDGSVFGNREHRLPAREHGWYREYTVPTPGLGHRGARRIVTGGDPPREWYYTADHYESFRAFQPPGAEAAR